MKIMSVAQFSHASRRIVMVAAIVIVVVLGAVSAPAGAVIVDIDSPLINGGKTDFGGYNSSHSWGAPTSPGQVTWGDNQGADSWVRVGGSLWIDAPFQAGCGSIRMTYRNARGGVVGRSSSPVACQNGLRPFAWKLPFEDSQINIWIQSVSISTIWQGSVTASQSYWRGD